MNNTTPVLTPRKLLKNLSIIHFGMLVGPLLAGIIFYTNTEIVPNALQNNSDILIYIFPVIGLLGIFASKYFYKQLLSELKSKETLKEKLMGLQAATLLSYALVEGPALLNIVWFNSTGNLLYLTIGAVLILYLFVLRPTQNKVENDLKLTGEHRGQFRKMDTPLP